MKLRSYKSLAGAAILAAVLCGCQAEMNEPALTTPTSNWKSNVTIAEVKALFGNSNQYSYKKIGVKDEETGEHYILKARISSSDASGNIYQKIYLQDETGAIPLSVRMNSYYNTYRLGQELLIDLTGLGIGNYGYSLQIGQASLYNGTEQTSFMPEELFKAHSEMNGNPNPDTEYVNYGEAYPADKLYSVTFNGLAQFPKTSAGAAATAIDGQLIELNNVWFSEPGVPFSEYQSSGVERAITDGSGNVIYVRTSGYANFYNDLTPEGVGTVRGLISRYGDKWQLSLRSRYDVIFEEKGTAESPFSIDEALTPVNDGKTAWVKGYIVGAPKSSVSTVTSLYDIDWSKDVEVDNAVVIAPYADCVDYQQCMIVELPAGTDIRAQVNLLDNEDNYGKQLSVCGTFGTVMGMGGVTGTTGASADFRLEEGQTPNPSIPAADLGTANNPYTVSDLLGLAAGTTKENVWVEGYIVGYMSEDTATYNQPVFSAAGATDASIILGPTADASALNICVPVKLKRATAARTDLSLKANPGRLGQHVRVYGNIASGFSLDIIIDQASDWAPM